MWSLDPSLWWFWLRQIVIGLSSYKQIQIHFLPLNDWLDWIFIVLVTWWCANSLMLSLVEQDQCEPPEFRCANNKCVQKIWRCDGDDDCKDGSDEERIWCPRKPPGDNCAPDEWQWVSKSQCLTPILISFSHMFRVSDLVPYSLITLVKATICICWC